MCEYNLKLYLSIPLCGNIKLATAMWQKQIIKENK